MSNERTFLAILAHFYITGFYDKDNRNGELVWDESMALTDDTMIENITVRGMLFLG
ncbi:hypothetical protein ACFL6U_04105 [Planctomycetota bacterium]